MCLNDEKWSQKRSLRKFQQRNHFRSHSSALSSPHPPGRGDLKLKHNSTLKAAVRPENVNTQLYLCSIVLICAISCHLFTCHYFITLKMFEVYISQASSFVDRDLSFKTTAVL